MATATQYMKLTPRRIFGGTAMIVMGAILTPLAGTAGFHLAIPQEPWPSSGRYRRCAMTCQFDVTAGSGNSKTIGATEPVSARRFDSRAGRAWDASYAKRPAP